MRHILLGFCVGFVVLLASQTFASSFDISWESVLRHHGSVMLIIDSVTGDILDANTAASDFYGHAIAVLQGMKIQEINTLSPKEVEEEMQRAASEERNYFQFSHKTTRGIKKVEVFSYPIYAQGRVLLSLIFDVTSRYEAEAQLEEYIWRFERAEEVAGVGHWEFDLPLGLVRGSDGSARIYGLKNEARSLGEIKELALVSYREELDQALRELILYGTPYDVEYRVERPDGSLVAVRAKAEYDKEQERVFGILFDQTEHMHALWDLEARNRVVKRLVLLILILGLVSSSIFLSLLQAKRKSHQRLLESEEKYRSLFEEMGDAFALYAVSSSETGQILDLQVLEANRVYETLRDTQDFLQGDGKTPWRKDYLTKMKKAYQELSLGVRSVSFLLQGKSPKRWFSLRAYQPKEGCIACIYEDITERKQAEESAARYARLLLDTQTLSRIGGWEYDVQNQTMFWTDEAYRLHGFEKDVLHPGSMEHIGQSMDCYRAEDRPRIQRAFQACIEEGTPYDLEFPFRAPPVEWIRTSAKPWIHEGKVARITGTLMDITAQKNQSEALKKAKDRLDTVLNSMDSLVYVMDMETYEILFINEYGRSVWGDVVGSVCWQTIQANQEGPCLFCTNDQLVGEDEKPTEGVRWDQRNTVNGNWYDLRDRAIEWVDGRTVRLSVATDITERMDMQQKLKEQARDLEEQAKRQEELYAVLDQELTSARVVYEQLVELPALDIPGVRIVDLDEPATFIGGDFSGVSVKGNKVICYLSDVTGHGLDGALVSLFIKNTMESCVAMLKEEEITTYALLDFLDRRMREASSGEYAVSLFLLIFDTVTGECTYQGSGFQNSPLVLSCEGEEIPLISRGLPVASTIPRELLDFSGKSAKLHQGDKVFLATDGIYEQEDKQRAMYEPRLLTLLKDYGDLPASSLLDLVWYDFQHFLGKSEQTDDVTCLLLERTGSKDAAFTLPSTFDALKEARERVFAYYKDHEDVENLCMAAHELLANAMEHGNRLNPLRKVRVILHPRVFVVEDEGAGFDWKQALSQPLTLDSASERGRGVAMVQLLVGRMIYNGAGNRVTLLWGL